MQLQCCHVLNAVQIWCVYVCEWREAKKLNHSQFCGMGSHFFWSVWRRRAVIRQKESVHYDHAIPPTSQRKEKGHDYKQSIEFSGSIPKGGALPGRQDGGSMELEDGSTFSESSIRSAQPSQLMWNLVTRGFDARMFLWSWNRRTNHNISIHSFQPPCNLWIVNEHFWSKLARPVRSLVLWEDSRGAPGPCTRCWHSNRSGWTPGLGTCMWSARRWRPQRHSRGSGPCLAHLPSKRKMRKTKKLTV